MIATPTRKKGNDEMASMMSTALPRNSRRRLLAAFTCSIFAAALLLAATAPASKAAVPPVLKVESNHFPTHFEPGGTGQYEFTVTNLGDVVADDDGDLVTLVVTLPEGVTATQASGPFFGFAWGHGGFGNGCLISEDGRTVTCEYNRFGNIGPIEPGRQACGHFDFGRCPLTVDVEIAPDAESGVAGAEACGGSAPECAITKEPATVSSTPAGFGLQSLEWEVLGEDRKPTTRAGGHPWAVSMRMVMNTVAFEGSGTVTAIPADSLRTVRFRLPRGLIGDPTATPTRCTRKQLGELACPATSQVGTVDIRGGLLNEARPLFNIVPPADAAARFGAKIGDIALVIADATVSPEGGYAIKATVRNISETSPLPDLKTTLWGVPADPSHDTQRGVCARNGGLCPVEAPLEPFLTNPTHCSGPYPASLKVEAWHERFGRFDSATVDPYPAGLTGCDTLRFEPEIEVQATNPKAGSPSGYEIELRNEGEGLVTSHLKDAELRLPEGVSINPAAAHGLEACSPDEIALESAAEPSCPDASRIGTVEIRTPVLDHPVSGGMFLAEQGDNPFGSLLAMYLVAEAPGVMIKLPGRIEADPQTGRLRTTFQDNPQLPFSDLTVRLKGGPTAPLVNPSTCGEQTAAMSLTPWARPGEPVVSTAIFEITEGPNGGPCAEDPADRPFEPGFAAGATSPIAGDFSPFVTRLTRNDGEEAVKHLTVALPEGLSGMLAGIPYCSEDALASFGSDGITEPGTAASEIEDPACPQASQVGRVTVGAGAGPNPFYLQTGKAYLAGPYEGAPLSLAIVTAAKAGPFDLGSVLVRSALHVNERTAQITVESDDIPTILEGIPLKLRDVRVLADREEFTLNPTNCQATKVWALVRGTGNTHANLANDFQVTNCAALDFEPRFGMQILNPGRRSTLRSFNPAMRFTVVPRPGDANLGPTQVVLPSSVILDQSNIRTICTRDQFAERRCPDASVYGFARAWSPLLDEPLVGPVFLGSSPNPLPDIIADLRGQVDVTLQGQIDSVRAARGGPSGESRGARMRNTFRVVPDVPVSRFQLTMFGGANRGVLVNSRDLCTSTERGVALFRGQNGALSLKRPAIRTAFRGCRKVRRMEIRRAVKRRAVLRKALRSGSYTPAQARRAIRG